MRFVWDDANLEHISKRGWEVADVEEAFADPYLIRTGAYNTPTEKRRAVTGQTSYGDIITIVYTMRGEAVRPFSVQIRAKDIERYKRRRRGK